MSLNVPAVMRGLATRLELVEGVPRAYPFPRDKIVVPAGIVAFPEGDVEYDTTFARGADRARFEVFVLAGRVAEQAGYERIAGWLAGEGPASVKAALEADPELAGAAPGGTIRVETGRLDAVMIGEVAYLAAGFTVDVVA